MNNASLQELFSGSIPYKIDKRSGDPLCQWLYLEKQRFTEPFFDETISACRHHPFNSKRQRCISTLEMLAEWSGKIRAVPPTAIIFHVSRCGSTLASQLLALSEENIVLSEVPFLDEVLLGIAETAEADADYRLFDHALRFYAMQRTEKQQRLFIKTDSWHLFFYQQLRQLYPAVPFILLYRHPAEVIRSQQKRRGRHAVQGVLDPGLFGFQKEESEALTLDQYMARVLERYFEVFLEVAGNDPLSVLVNYNEGPTCMMERIAVAANMPLTDTYRQQVAERAGFHGKYPDAVFGAEGEAPVFPDWCDKAIALYEKLDQLRINTPDNKIVQ